MKKILLILLAILLAVCLTNCSKEDNPLEPNLNLGDDSGLADTTPPHVLSATTGLVTSYARISVTFSEDMIPETLNNQSITVFQTAEAANVKRIDGLIEYLIATRTLTFTPIEPLPTGAFILTIRDSAQDLAENSIDGNGNGRIDGVPYDYFRTTFYTEGGMDGLRDIDYPYLITTVPSAERITDHQPQIALFFADGPIDTTLLTTNLVSVTANGTPVSLERMEFSEDHVIFRPTAPINNNTLCQVLVMTDAIHDLTGNALMKYEDGNLYLYENGLSWQFFVADEPVYPMKTGLTAILNEDHLPIGFRVRFSKRMDTSTFTTANIRARDRDGLVYGTIIPDEDTKGFHYYYHDGVVTEVEAWLAADIVDVNGYPLDGDGSGIGGTSTDWIAVTTTQFEHNVNLELPVDNSTTTNPVFFKWRGIGPDIAYYEIKIEPDDDAIEWELTQTTDNDTFRVELPDTTDVFMWAVSAYNLSGDLLASDYAMFTLTPPVYFLEITAPEEDVEVENPVVIEWETNLLGIEDFTLRWYNYNTDEGTWEFKVTQTATSSMRTMSVELTPTDYSEWQVQVVANDASGNPLDMAIVSFILIP